MRGRIRAPPVLAIGVDAWYDKKMKAYVGIVDETGLRALLPDESSIRPLMMAGPRSACIWAAVEDDGVREIEAELRSGHRSGALSLLLNQAVELVPIRADDRLP